MKLSNKIFLATGAFAVLASSTAFAGGIDLVKSDAITVNMNGEIDMKITHEHKKGEDDQGTQIETNFDNLGFDFTYKINNSLSFVAQTDWTQGYEENSTVKNDGAWVGVDTAYGLVRIGYEGNSFDDLGIDNSELLDNGMASSQVAGGIDGETQYESSIVYEFNQDNYKFSATYTKAETGSDASEGDSNDLIPEIMQAAGFVELGDLEIGGGLGKTKVINNGDTTYQSKYAQMQAKYKMGDLTLAVLAGYEDQEKVDVTTNTFEFDALYDINNNMSVMGGYERLVQDIADSSIIYDYKNDDTLELAYIGMAYKFGEHVTLNTEYGYKKGSMVSSGTGTQAQFDETYGGILVAVTF